MQVQLVWANIYLLFCGFFLISTFHTLGFEVSLEESASSVSCIHTLTNANLIEEEVIKINCTSKLILFLMAVYYNYCRLN